MTIFEFVSPKWSSPGVWVDVRGALEVETGHQSFCTHIPPFDGHSPNNHGEASHERLIIVTDVVGIGAELLPAGQSLRSGKSRESTTNDSISAQLFSLHIYSHSQESSWVRLRVSREQPGMFGGSFPSTEP